MKGTHSPSPEVLDSQFLCEPAAFPSCHASSIVETGDGSLLAAWFGGSHESAADVQIYLSRWEATGWSTPRAVAGPAADGHSCYNPVLFAPRNGPLLLFYKSGRGPQTWHGLLTTSSDDGSTWSPPRRLPDGILGPIKNKPVEREDGVLLCASSDEADGWRVHMEFSPNGGETWTRTEPLNDGFRLGAIQPSLLSLGSRRWCAIGRTQQKRLFRITSADDGATWGDMTLLDLPNPNSGTDAVRLQDGRFLLVYNHSTHARSPLNVALSADAENWTPVLELETEPGEYSYPAVIQSRDGRVHVTYTWQRTHIRHVVLGV